MLAGSITAVQHCLQTASDKAKLAGLSFMAGNTTITHSPTLAKILPLVIRSIGRLSTSKMSSDLGDIVQKVLLAAMLVCNVEIFNATINELLPKEGLEISRVVLLLKHAAFHLRQADFQRILELQTAWTVYDGYIILQYLAVYIQGPEEVIGDLAQVLVNKLEHSGLLRNVVNYEPPRATCIRTCTIRHNHIFAEPLFAMCVTSGNYKIAELVAPYVDLDSDKPTALYYLLSSPDGKVHDHLHFLRDLDGHMRYLCNPIGNRTALQAVSRNTSKLFQQYSQADLSLYARCLLTQECCSKVQISYRGHPCFGVSSRALYRL